ncbi:MAG: TolC family protein [Anaeromyxobacteraceae bacterium]|nr:TolC family protein [Anaeromyxobacteraceae bacterium]
MVGVALASEPLTLASATERALARSPEVRSAESDVRAARARLEEASQPLASNPELLVGAGPRNTGPSRTLDYEVALSQRVEAGGQRGARMASARAALGAAESRLSAAKARLTAEVRELLGRASAARLRAEVAIDAHRFSEQAAEAAERRFQAGDVARIDVNSARLERGRAARARQEAELEHHGLVSELELALGAEPSSLQDVSAPLDDWVPGPVASEEALVQEALAARHDLAAARLEVIAAAAEASLAGRMAVPSPTFSFSAAREERATVVLGTLSLELPFFARNLGARGATVARLEQARETLSALERRVSQEVRLAAERVRAARRMVAAFDPAMASALAEDLALATRAYDAGQIDFLRYQLIRRDAIDARRERIDALEALSRAMARLEGVLGQGLPPN